MKREQIPVTSTYGAPLGRHTHAAPFYGRIRARRVKLSQGYDQGGAYWGTGQNLYYVYGSEDGEIFVRSPDNKTAIAKAIEELGTDNKTKDKTQ